MLLSLSAGSQVEGADCRQAITDVGSEPDSPSGLWEKDTFEDDSDFAITTTNGPNSSTFAEEGESSDAARGGAKDRLEMLHAARLPHRKSPKDRRWIGHTIDGSTALPNRLGGFGASRNIPATRTRRKWSQTSRLSTLP